MNKDLDLIKVLKDCPKGTKFYSKCFGELTLDCIIGSRICLKDYSKFNRLYEKDGKYVCCDETAEIDLLPSKDQRDWSKWHIPFVDGDIIFTEARDHWLSIFKRNIDEKCETYVDLCIEENRLFNDTTYLCPISDIIEQRFATEEEKKHLFDAIKKHGYNWNAEKKVLEESSDPEFKDGDIIHINVNECNFLSIYKGRSNREIYNYLDLNLSDDYLSFSIECNESVPFEDSRDLTYRLATEEEKEHLFNVIKEKGYKWDADKKKLSKIEKFDIKTLIPFESKVLVRDEYNYWCGSIYTGYKNNKFHTVDCSYYNQCIPYKGNEHLFGTKDDCEEYYKIW